MNIFVERDLNTPSLLNIADAREIDVAVKTDHKCLVDGVAQTVTVYEVRANFDSADGYENSWRLVQYQTREAAEAYHRYLGMTIARSGLRQESGVIIPRLGEEDALVLSRKFEKMDADSDERFRREAEAESARDADDFEKKAQVC